jgi:hypothetical protein
LELWQLIPYDFYRIVPMELWKLSPQNVVDRLAEVLVLVIMSPKMLVQLVSVPILRRLALTIDALGSL